MGKTCSNCGAPVPPKGAGKGYCGKCYQRWRKYGDASDAVLQRHPRKGSMCTNCGEPVSPSSARGYCDRCYKRWQVHGDPTVVLPRSLPPVNRKHTLTETYFEDITTPEQAYWLGFLTADGCVHESSNGYAVSLLLAKKDAEHVALFAQALGSSVPPRPDPEGRVYVQLNSRRLVESLKRIGVTPRKSATAEPWDGPADLMPHYWRGLFDGDGCIHRAKRSRSSWTLTQVGSRACVARFAEWAVSVCGTKATVRHMKGDCWMVAIGGSYMPQNLATALYRDAPVALSRKLKLATELMGADFRQMNNGNGNPRNW